MDDTTAIPLEELLRHRPWVRSLARQLVLDDTEVDDIEQQTWLAALQRPPQEGGVLTWLSRVVRNVASKQRRADVRRLERQADVRNSGSAPSAADVVVEAELHEELVRALRGLREPYRTTLLLRYFEGLPPRDVAHRMGVPVETVRVRNRRGIELLRERFDARHGSREAWVSAFLPFAANAEKGIAAVASTSHGTAFLSTSLMTTSTKLLGTAALFTSILWIAWPTADESDSDAPGVTPGTITGVAATKSQGQKSTKAPLVPLSVSSSSARKLVQAAVDPRSPASMERPGAWLSVTRTHASGPITPSLLSARFVDTSGQSLAATGEDGNVRVPDALAGPAVLWLTTSEDDGLHRFPARSYPEGTTALEIRGTTPLDLRFMTESGVLLERTEVERRYAEAGLGISGRWIEAGRFAQENPLRAMVEPPPDDLWMRDVTFVWHDSTTLRAKNTPSEGRWSLLLTLAQSPAVRLEVPDVSAGEARTVMVPVPMVPEMQTVRFVDADSGAPLGFSAVTPYIEHGDDEAFFAGPPRHTDGNGELALPSPRISDGRFSPSSWLLETDSHIGMVHAREFTDAPPTYIKDIERKGLIRGNAYTPDGQPAIGALVVHMVKGYARRTRVDQQGKYELTGVLPEGNVGLLLVTNIDAMEVQQAHTYVGSGDEVELDIGHAMDPHGLATVRGRITAGTTPIEGAMVAVEALETSDAERKFTRTNDMGEYVLIGVAPGHAQIRVLLGDYRVSDDYGLRTRSQAVVLVGGNTVTRDFVLPDGAILVQVLGPGGKPLVGIDVCAEPEAEGLAEDLFPGFSYRMGWSGKTDADGNISLQGLLRGSPMRVFGQDRSSNWQFERREVMPALGGGSPKLVVRRGS